MILTPIEDPQKYIELCLEIQEKHPWLKYGFNLYLNYKNKIYILLDKEDKVIYAPFFYKKVKLHASGRGEI